MKDVLIEKLIEDSKTSSVLPILRIPSFIENDLKKYKKNVNKNNNDTQSVFNVEFDSGSIKGRVEEFSTDIGDIEKLLENMSSTETISNLVDRTLETKENDLKSIEDVESSVGIEYKDIIGVEIIKDDSIKSIDKEEDENNSTDILGKNKESFEQQMKTFLGKDFESTSNVDINNNEDLNSMKELKLEDVESVKELINFGKGESLEDTLVNDGLEDNLEDCTNNIDMIITDELLVKKYNEEVQEQILSKELLNKRQESFGDIIDLSEVITKGIPEVDEC